MPATRWTAMLVAAGLMLSACGGSTKTDSTEAVPTAISSAATSSVAVADTASGAPTQTDSSAPTTTGATDTVAPAPVGPLTFTADEAAAGQATITLAAGGTVTAKAGDGSTFTLTVPPGAVDADTVVKMTPLTDVKGFATTAPFVAVRLDPDGTQFAQPAKLEITSPSAAPIKEQFLFQAAHDGTGVASAAVDPSSTAIVMYLSHFSIAGETGVNDSTMDQLVGVKLADVLGDLQKREQDTLQRARQQQLLGTAESGGIPPQILEARQAVDVVIALAVSNFPTRCSTAGDLIKFVIGHERQGQMLGQTDDNAGFWDAAQKAFPVCEKEAIRSCKNKHDPGILLKFWIGWERQRQLVGAGAGLDVAGLQKKAETICLPQRYIANGGGHGISVTGKIRDLALPFKLVGVGNGFTVNFLYLPAESAPEDPSASGTDAGLGDAAAANNDAAGRSGTVTYEGSGGGMMMTGKGTYTITGDEGGPLTMNVETSGCVDQGGCKDNTETITLTPTRVRVLSTRPQFTDPARNCERALQQPTG